MDGRVAADVSTAHGVLNFGGVEKSKNLLPICASEFCCSSAVVHIFSFQFQFLFLYFHFQFQYSFEIPLSGRYQGYFSSPRQLMFTADRCVQTVASVHWPLLSLWL